MRMDTSSQPQFTIGRLAKEAGVGIDTVRFYERRGLLPEPARTASGYRVYGSDAAARILFVKRAKLLGFTLDEIKTLLHLQDHGGQKSEVRDLTRLKLLEIESKISDLKRMQLVLQDLSKECSGEGSVDGCPIIEAMTSLEAGPTRGTET